MGEAGRATEWKTLNRFRFGGEAHDKPFYDGSQVNRPAVNGEP